MRRVDDKEVMCSGEINMLKLDWGDTTKQQKCTIKHLGMFWGDAHIPCNINAYTLHTHEHTHTHMHVHV